MQDSFLLDEVRCGFMVPSAIKQAWAAELEVLKEIDRVCKKHKIQYFADWGTFLGTVRHGGFIPWDDDLDIVMKREDYIKFMTVARFDMDAGFDVQTFRNHDDCWLFMGKVVGRNGFCFEKEHLQKFHNFLYIASVDIFVLDYVYRDPKKEEKRRELCKYMLAVADSIVEHGMTRADREKRYKLLEERCGYKLKYMDDPIEMRRYLYGEIESIFAQVPEQEADKLTQLFPWGLKGDWFQFPKQYYEESVYLPFEYTSMPVPKMYDKMLRQRYGDYVRLVKSAGAHDYPFFEGQKNNLEKVLDFELPEFRVDKTKIFRSKEEEACKSLSNKVMTKECAGELWRMKDELTWLIKKISVDSSCTEQALDLLVASQQLAIDMGNLLEQFMGERCSIVPLLEQYCEVLYKIYMQLSSEVNGDEVAYVDEDSIVACISMAANSLGTLQKSIMDNMEQNIWGRESVILIPVLAKDWCGMYSLWQEYIKNPKYDVYVVPLPYYFKDYDGSTRKVCYEASDFPGEVVVSDYNILTPEYLELLHPEIIVIQNPYDSWNPAISVPEQFYSLNLRKYTDKLIYVPPFTVEEYTKSNEREYFNMRYYVTMPGVVYADCVIVQSESIQKMYIEKLIEFAGDETKTIWDKKVVVGEDWDREQKGDEYVKNCQKNDRGTCSKKKILYGISLGSYIVDVEAGQAKIERNIQFFEDCKERIELAVLIYPDNEAAEPVCEYIDGMSEKYPGVISKKSVAECDIKDFDAYYGDVMPLVMEFRGAGKPVMVQEYEIV